MARRPFAAEIMRVLAAAWVLPHRVRPALLRLSGVRIGRRVLILSGLRPQHGGVISIGDGVFISFDVFLDAGAAIDIRNNVQIADHVRIITSTHVVGPPEFRAGRAHALPVEIGCGVWLGSGVTVLPGVRVAPGCVIAAGAVVTQSTAPDGLYAGVPARRVRDLSISRDDGGGVGEAGTA